MKIEQKQKQVLHDIKDIFAKDFDLEDETPQAPIIDQLVNIVQKVTGEDIDTNEKLLQ